MANKKTRPLKIGEYTEIIKLMLSGFTYEENGCEKEFLPNPRIALILQLQASLGLRIGDILKLKPSVFKTGMLEMVEQKTGKTQYREVNQYVLDIIKRFALDNEIKSNEALFSVGVRAIQKQLKIVVDHLDLDNISTHSFRKLFAMTTYKESGNDIDLVRDLLNHSSIETTQKYIKTNQEEINKISKGINFIIEAGGDDN